jgi:hypothetical protein
MEAWCWVALHLEGHRGRRLIQEESVMQERATAKDRIRELEMRHHTLDRELRVLSRRAYLTPYEQRLAQELKKQKLNAKDALHALRSNGSH